MVAVEPLSAIATAATSVLARSSSSPGGGRTEEYTFELSGAASSSGTTQTSWHFLEEQLTAESNIRAGLISLLEEVSWQVLTLHTLKVLQDVQRRVHGANALAMHHVLLFDVR